MRVLGTLLLIGLVAAGAGLGFIYSGRADVAATSPHWAITEWVLSTAMERSVEQHARGIEPPRLLDEPASLRAGAEAYDAMCVACHGAPGVEPAELAAGLEPEPPELVEAADEWSAAELFWITKHGVRMTGMPGFGPTHSDEELWELVALVERLPRMSAEEYRDLAGPSDAGMPGHEPHGHHHAMPDGD
jgi:mono/diheme cytochrome c family protein